MLNRSIELADCGQLCNYTTGSFTTACVTHLDQVRLSIDQTFDGLNGIIKIENGGLNGGTFR